MKSLLWFSLFVLTATAAHAENFASPLLCPLEDVQMQIENSSGDIQAFWFHTVGAMPFEESYVEVKAHGTLSVALSDYYHGTESAVAIKSQTNALSVSASCKGSKITWKVDTSASPWRKLKVPLTATGALKLSLANLAQQSNTLEITYEGLWGKISSETLQLGEEFLTKTTMLNPPWGATHISLHAQGRWTGKVFTTTGEEIPLEEEVVTLTQAPTQRYFLFAAQDATYTPETFVVPMQDPALIQESLDQIQHPDMPRLLIARIEKSMSGLNRDFSSPLKTPWSWQVAQAQNYADYALITCDGTPALVEERLNTWLMDTGATICFWNYRVVRELSLQEVMQSPSSSLPAPTSLPHKH